MGDSRALIPLLALLVGGTAGGCKDCRAQLDRAGKPWKGDEEIGTSPAEVAGFTLEPTAAGTPRIAFNHSPLVEVKFVFFADDWKFVPARVLEGPPRGEQRTFTLEVPRLGLRGEGTVEPGGAGELVYRWALHAEHDVANTMGGGLEFRLAKNSTLVAQGARKPILHPDNGGFVWDVGTDRTIEVAFEGELERVFFERNRPNQIRAFIFGERIVAGDSEFVMRVRLPAGGQIVTPLQERYAPLDRKTWTPDILAWDDSPVDLRFLADGERPAGRRGRVEAKAGRLVFADGSPARFWGTNIAARTLFTGTHEQVATQARRLASLGFNLVRLHHHDSAWYRPNVFAAGPSTRKLRAESLDALDWWVKCLQDEGIYVWIDLHVGRRFVAGDEINGFAELAARKDEGKSFNYVNADIEARMAEFAAAYFDRSNRYTGRRYPDDPGVVAVLVTNENDLSFHGAKFVAGLNAPSIHAAAYAEQVRDFARVAGLPVRQALDPRKPGPGKIALGELQARFSERAIAQLRTMGYRGPVATTNFWGRAPLLCLPPLLVGDIVDVHAYGEAEFLAVNPLYAPNFVTWIGSGRAAGKPLTVSEWNVPRPAPDRFAAPLYVASVAALQGWDAPMLYAYSQMPLAPPEKLGKWTALHDPGAMAMMPAAALAYRRGDVAEAATRYRIEVDRDTVYGSLSSAITSPTLRTLVEQSRFELVLPDLPELSWDTAPPPDPGAQTVDGLSRSFLAADATSVESDTGQLRRDWVSGVHTIDTPRTQAIQGWLGGRTVALTNLETELTTPKASVALSSLDGQPITSSTKLLLSVVAQVESADGRRLPWLAEPIRGTIVVRSNAARLLIVPLGTGNPDHEAAAIEASVDGDRHTFALPEPFAGHWFSLERAD